MSARINGITNTNNDVVIENNMKELPLVREEYYLTRESFNKFIANDISFGSNISISGDLIPLNSVTSDLGSSTKYWSNAYIRDVSVSNMSISGNINVSENINITENINISGNINVSENINISGNLLSLSNTSQIGSSENYWSNAYIRDVSINNISISGNNSVGGNISISGNNNVGGNISISGDIIPLNTAISDLGSNEKYWRNAYMRDLSVTNISVSGSITIPNGSIVTNDISNLNITHEKIANNAIQTHNIDNSAITHAKIANNAIQAHNIANNAITHVKIAEYAIKAHNIDASAVINSKIAYGTITSDKINSSGTWSFTNISISGDLIPLNSVASDLGSSTNYWSNAYIHDISASNISVSGNINVDKNISISGDLEPLYSVRSDLGSSSNYWRNAYIDNIDISSHIRIGNGHFGGKITATTTPHELIIDPYSFENSPYTGTDASGRVVILGDLIVRGDTTTITSNIVDISDLTLNIASNATKNTVFGIESGITLGSDSYASLLYNKDSNSWRTNIGIEISGNISLSGNLISSSNTSLLGSSANYWNDAYITNLNVTNFVNTIDASYLTNNTITSAKIANGTIVDTDISNNASIAFSKINASLAIADSDISSNAAINGSKLADASIASSKIDSTGTWTFTNISGTHMTISGNLIPLTANNSSTLGSTTNYWRNAYIQDLSVNNTMSISGNLEPLNNVNSSRLGNIGKLWSNAYIRDLSIANITISGNILPLDNSSSDLGSSLTRWRNIYVNDLSVSTINGEAYGGPIDLTSVSGNIIPSINNTFRLGDVSRNWSNAYIHDISATNISVSGNLTTDISNFRITSTHRIYQEINSDISWNGVNGYYGLAKDAYPSLNPYSSGVKAVSNWTGRSQGVDTNFWESVCWSPERGIFVAVANVGNNNSVMTSYDGISWTGISQGVDISSYWNSVCWSPERGIFVAVAQGGNNRVMTSDTGTTWTSISGGVELNEWRDVCWSPELGIFVAVSQDGNNRAMTSSNGTSWTSISGGVDDNAWHSVCWSPELGIFVAVAADGNNRVMTSTNGISWTGTSQGVLLNEWYSVCWSPQLGIFVAVGDSKGNNRVMTSSNGISWTGASQGVLLNAWNSVCWSPQLGIFVAVSSSGNNRVMTSANGINWTSISQGVEPNYWNSVCWSPELGIFTAVASGGDTNIRVMTSSLKGRPPTSTNVFDSSFNAIDESGNWTFSNMSISGNFVPIYVTNTSTLGSTAKYWRNAYITDLSVNNTMSISGNLEPLNNVNTSRLGNIGKLWSNAYIRDLSVANITISGTITIPTSSITSSHIADGTIADADISGTANINGSKLATASIASSKIDSTGTWTFTNISGTHMSISGNLVPLYVTNTSTLGSTTNYWRNAYIANIDVSGDISNVTRIIPQLRNDISSSLGTIQNTWQKAFISDLSGITKINGISWPLNSGSSDFSGTDISTSLIPRNPTSIDLGSTTNYWRNAYIRDISTTNIDVIGTLKAYKYDETYRKLGENITNLSGGIYDLFGSTVAINDEGNIIAVTSGGFSPTGTHLPTASKFVRIYKYNDISWVKISPDISGASAVSLDSTGTIAAISNKYINSHINNGQVKVYRYVNDNSWVQISQTIVYTTDDNAISLNASGTILAIGSPSDNANAFFSGSTSVYKHITDGSWIQLGQTIGGGEPEAEAGYSVSLDSTGYILAIGAVGVSSNFNISNGRVRVYKYNDVSWVLISQDINGTTFFGRFGYSVSLNSNGTLVACGAKTSFNSGYVTVYKYISNGSWIPQGQTIIPEVAGDDSVISVSLNNEGNILAIGGPYNDGTTTGHIRVYKYNDVSWIQISTDIDGEVSNEQLGYSVALNGLGNIFVAGAPRVSSDRGQAKVYKLTDLTQTLTSSILPLANNTYSLGSSSLTWSNAYIRDLSIANITISGNMLPLLDISSDLGSSLKRWRNIYVNDLSVSRINGQVYSAGGTAIDLTSVSGNIIPSLNNTFRLGDVSRNWSNAYIRDLSASNISVSGNMLSQNNTSQVPVSYSTFSVVSAQNRNLPSYIDTLSPNVWIPASAYDISKVVLSNRSVIKIEVKVNYTASPEADQTLSFRVLESSNNGLSYITTPVFSDISLGSSMGVTINNIYNGSYYDDLSGITLSGNIITYRLEFRRDCPPGNTIKTSYGIQASTGNYISLQELYKPP